MGLPFISSAALKGNFSVQASFSFFFLTLFSRYGDMRKEIGFKIRDMWYNLGEFQLKNCLYPSSQAVFHILYYFMKAAHVQCGEIRLRFSCSSTQNLFPFSLNSLQKLLREFLSFPLKDVLPCKRQEYDFPESLCDLQHCTQLSSVISLDCC